MTNHIETCNRPAGGVASIATLDLVAATIERLSARRNGVTGIGVLYGPSGWGKTFATNALANENRAYYVQMLSNWKPQDFLCKILDEMGIGYIRRNKDGGPIASSIPRISKLVDMISAQLAASRRTLIIDEFDHATKRDSMVELTRDLYEGSQGSLLLVGEELLPSTLENWERFYRRVSVWAPAAPVSIPDAEKLAPIYCPGVSIAEDALAHLVSTAKGSVGRVVNSLDAIREHCMTHALDSINKASLADIALPSGRAPMRRI